MWVAVVAAARGLREGRFDSLAQAVPGSSLDAIFASLRTGGVQQGTR
jgi:hypothetical protein